MGRWEDGLGEEGNSIKGFRKSERPNRLAGCYTYFPLSKPEKVA
ncbi:hypothetical protein OSCI_4080026 [Kamptonema sp. PCC 6506]|nr:hypothetical protein OSCI_4080026 [Kamptonema sp. PCC 6506]